MTALVDTNVLVYRYDSRDPDKQKIATKVLRDGLATDSIRIAYQSIVEFYAAVTRPFRIGVGRILEPADATHEIEELLVQFDVLYPDENIVRAALRAAAAYQLSWFDANIWAYASVHGLTEILSEDFQHDRFYGGIRAIDPFI
ncbi:MAG TPA: PIN domain-containing protein [Thermoanaerobaculia bacterium]|nr:PIN domain-containing protein [Thermoanaerobaculia bacterium]